MKFFHQLHLIKIVESCFKDFLNDSDFEFNQKQELIEKKIIKLESIDCNYYYAFCFMILYFCY